MPHNYTIEIFFSDEHVGFIAVVPELPECSAFGENQELGGTSPRLFIARLTTVNRRAARAA